VGDILCSFMATYADSIHDQDSDAEEVLITTGILTEAFGGAVEVMHPLLCEEQLRCIVEAWQGLGDDGLVRACTSALPMSTFRNSFLDALSTLSASASQQVPEQRGAAPSFKIAGISKRGMAQQRARSKKKR